MKKYLFALLLAGMLCSCSTPKLANTVWDTVTDVTNGSENGLKVTTLSFRENGKVNIYTTIVADNGSIAVAPIKTGEGTYQTTGNLRKNAEISIDGVSLGNTQFVDKGLVNIKKEVMALVGTDSVASFYIKNNELKFEDK